MTNDEISVDVIAEGLQTQLLGQRIVYYERIGSTNDVAKQLADAGEAEGTLVIADEQTAGRGRLKRTWIAPPRSSILMSLVLRPELAPAQATRVTMAVALGACDAIRAETNLNAQIKWPNDILIDGKKCAGILSESGIIGDKLEYVVPGLGVNVNFAISDIVTPALAGGARVSSERTKREISQHMVEISRSTRNDIAGIKDATTIADELGKPFPRVQLVQAILRSIEKNYVRLRAGEDLRKEFANRLVTLRQKLNAQTPWGIEKGIAEDIDNDGALLLRRADGSLVRLVAGEVTLSTRP
ncbi:MAG: biotin--[acetyl-CoA-carboxylase] ligase [Chloroflexi bacterium]|nr:biotin--[acetyl-CoA-carboxylase] ligase [Chloroflexota bacterium]